MLKAKKTAEARKFAEEVIAKAVKARRHAARCSRCRRALRSPAAKGDKELLALSLKAAEAMLKIAGEKDCGGAVLRRRGAVRRRRQGQGQGVRREGHRRRRLQGLKTQLEKLTKKYSNE